MPVIELSRGGPTVCVRGSGVCVPKPLFLGVGGRVLCGGEHGGPPSAPSP